jgi:Ribbon-helix-helix protein, copG family
VHTPYDRTAPDGWCLARAAIPYETHRRVLELARARGVTLGEIVRLALRAYVDDAVVPTERPGPRSSNGS